MINSQLLLMLLTGIVASTVGPHVFKIHISGTGVFFFFFFLAQNKKKEIEKGKRAAF